MRRTGKSFSDAEIRTLARSLLSFLEAPNSERVEILACLRAGHIWTIRGIKRLVYEICADSELGKDDARTEYPAGGIVIKAKLSVHRALEAGDGRARFTLAHELGHAVLHDGMTRARRTDSRGSRRHRWEKPYEDPERQANVFAASLLIDAAVARNLRTPKEIMRRFGVSLKAAEICFDILEEERERPDTARRVKEKAAAFCAQPSFDPVLSLRFLPDPCENCGERALLPEGTKVRCQCCKAVMDFQDGDVVGTTGH